MVESGGNTETAMKSLFLAILAAVGLAGVARGEDAKITHSFLATGGDTRVVAGDGSVVWTYPLNTRDGWVLPNGDFLLTVSQNKEKGFPGGGVVMLSKEGKTLFEYKGQQSEVNTSQLLDNGNIMLTEAGPKPRILEVNREGKVVVEVPIACQTTNFHMQTRMSRKLANGNYLVPHLFDKVVREYTPEGKIAWEVKTPNWAFTAIRVPNGNTLINCTYGNEVIEVDPQGKTVWRVTNDDLEGKPIKDACGGQRLPNGNTVITSYGASGDAVKLTEVTPEKKIVWTYRDGKNHGIHHFQILDTNGKPLEGKPMR